MQSACDRPQTPAPSLNHLGTDDINRAAATIWSPSSTFCCLASLCITDTMSGYYPNNQNFPPPQYYSVNPNLQNLPNLITPDGSFPHAVSESPVYHGMPGPFAPYPDPHMQQPYIGQYPDASGPMDASQDPNARVRRRPAPGEHVKHRRTRSGCFTCRQRRVKVRPSLSLPVYAQAKPLADADVLCSVMKPTPCAKVRAAQWIHLTRKLG